VLGSYGLRTYIWNNRLKSLILLAGFPFLLLLIIFGVALVLAAFENPTVGDGMRIAIQRVPSLIPIALVGALIWFVIAWFANTSIIAAITGAHEVDRASEPRLWNPLENLCISRGIPMPKLRIIETDARNAFASGVRKSQYSITVTRGLMNALDDAELEAVLAHELTHIRNRDVQLLVIAAVFVGIITLVGDLLIRSPRALLYGSSSGSSSSSGSGGWRIGRGGSSGGGKGKGGGAIILILIAVAIFLLARLLAIGLRLAMSRKREYLADAGAVELTKNPDAMIGALRKIAGHSEILAPRSVQEMFLDHSEEAGFSSWFSTHPSIDDRVAALVRFGGGRDMPVPEAIEASPEFGKRLEAPSLPAASETPAAPWGETPPGPWENTR
jgi:heat shock protein HtpX